ncbi:MAG: alanine--tRNA ligase [Thermodesulfovibrionales bacterium]|nr:alanine--tRNA ligase [Thermodesulfovibrionales bacterium]
MKSADIRKSFLEYFKEKGHEPVGSSSLMPRHDPTLLFTNAGMVQFKSVFLGEEKRPYARAVTCQKCIRAGGKHSDIENVGHTRRHHTFFEMLGNFSFGDYFKEDAVSFAWELLTERYGLPKDRLWVSIYEDDDEAGRLWHEKAGVPKDRIVRLGAKDNFWQMADTGPCGPCSEIIIDQGPEMGCGKKGCAVGCDCDRYLELWNLVFMQFNRDEHGTLTPLPKPSIDTGMGLERISAVLQDKTTNFDTDLFSGIISSICAHTGASYGRGAGADTSIRVIADHMRAISFLMADGLMPSNEGRGYVLKRIIRRAARHARLLGREEPVLFKIVDSVTQAMGGVYPELADEGERTMKVLKVEEERFGRTLEQGIKILDDLIAEAGRSNASFIPGEEIFKLYDTYGFPLDLAKDAALDAGLGIDEEGFHNAMEAQRERARASWVGEEAAVSSIYRGLLSEAGKTEFAGYSATESKAVVKVILKDGRVTEELKEGEEGEVFLDITPFYGESGGQVGDTGMLHAGGLKADVLDTKKPLEGVISHVVKVRKGTLQVWKKLACSVDAERRSAVMRNHTVTHLLQAALRAVVGEHVKQAGSLVGPGRLRFDFTHFTGLGRDELDAVEEMVNEKIMQDLPVTAEEMDIKEATAGGAIALFGEKYGERVRVISVPGTSTELCGGTHCSATGQIGLFKILSEGSVASGIRRIEAVTGRESLNYLRSKDNELREIALLLKVSEGPAEKVRALLEEMKELRKAQEKMKGSAAKDIALDAVGKAKEFRGIKVVSEAVEGLEPKDLRVLADNIRDRIHSGIIVLASIKDGQASFVSMVTPDLIKRFSADKILKEVALMTDGRGGGKPELAQGGTKNPANLGEALKRVFEIVEKMC